MWRHCLVVTVLCLFLLLIVNVKSSTDGLDVINLDAWIQSRRQLVVVLYEPETRESKEALHTIAQLMDQPDISEDVAFGKSSDSKLSGLLQVSKFPQVVMKRGESYVLYHGEIEAEAVIQWIDMAATTATQQLNDDSFEHLTQASTGATTGDWLVMFYKDDCKECTNALHLLESYGISVRNKMNVAKVDINRSPVLMKRFSIKQFPETILFKQGKMYRYELPKLTLDSLYSFADGWYRNSKAEQVPVQLSSFDQLTQDIADRLKEQLNGENRVVVMAALSGFAVFFLLIALCCCRSVISQNVKQKTD